jgi:phenylpyruvate tautomerase PptA (4-oxalocrotonate tautomerase family)
VSHAGSAEEADAGLTVDVHRGTPTAEELAALIAVVTEAYAEEAARATVEESAARSAWSVSQRSLREPLRRDIGWGRFG